MWTRPTLVPASTGGAGSGRVRFQVRGDDFYGAHPAGLYFLMADGSGRFIKAGIGPSVYGDLASRNWAKSPALTHTDLSLNYLL